MNASIPVLQELHSIEVAAAGDLSPERAARAAELRASLPPPVLAHYNRLVVNGAKPFAEVRRGVCGACHLKLASWIRQVAASDELHLCEHCGAFLVFVPEEPVRAAVTPRVARRKASRIDLIRVAATAGVH